MGLVKSFLQKMLRDGYTGAVNPALDPIRSEFPRLVESGYVNYGAGAPAKDSILLVPSSKVFHLKNLMIGNRDAVGQYAYFYDGPGTSVSVGGIQVAASTTNFISEEHFKGWIFESAVHVSVATSLTEIRAGGYIRDTDSGS